VIVTCVTHIATRVVNSSPLAEFPESLAILLGSFS